MSLFALVHLDDLLGVDGEVFIGIYHHTEESRVCLEAGRGQIKHRVFIRDL